MSEQGPDRERLKQGIGIIVDEAKAAGATVIRTSGVESLGENLKETIQGALSARDKVVMVRLNKESLSRLDDLVDSGVVSSRSEAAAFLIGEGIKARAGIFERIAEKTDQIRKVREELRMLLEEPAGEGPDQE